MFTALKASVGSAQRMRFDLESERLILAVTFTSGLAAILVAVDDLDDAFVAIGVFGDMRTEIDQYIGGWIILTGQGDPDRRRTFVAAVVDFVRNEAIGVEGPEQFVELSGVGGAFREDACMMAKPIDLLDELA